MNLACRGYSVENELIGFGCNASILYCHHNASADQKSMNSNLWSHFKEGEVMVMVFNANFRDSITFYQEFRYDGFWIYKEDGLSVYPCR
jgi:hypothetical protein